VSDADLIVLGGGPAGLWAAWRAAIAGHRVIVVERAEVPGGMAGSFEVAGQRVDFGSHRLHPSTDSRLMADICELLGDDLQSRTRNGRLRLNGRWVGFPLRTLNLLRNVSLGFATGAAFDAAIAPLRGPRDDTFKAHLRAGLGPSVSRSFYEPYADKLWGTPADQLDADLARRRVSASSPLAIARRLARGASQEGRRFFYPRCGYGQICERILEAAVAAGVEVRLGTTAIGLELGNSGAGVTVTTPNGRLAAARCWSTIPISALVRIAHPPPPTCVLKAIESLRHRAMVLVYLVCDQARYTSFDAHYLPGPGTPVSRLSEPKNYRDGPDPADRTVLCAEVPCWKGDTTWMATDEDLGAIVAESLVAEGLPRPQHVATETRRLPQVYPVYVRGYREGLEAVAEWSDSLKHLTVFGRQGLFVPDNLHHVLSMGQAAADALGVDGSFDQQAWSASLDAFTGHVVED
tara:strand:+ start:1364 stop:2752 length:1389 start_codon:yes stop_codon:yes gene_type:complete